MLHLLITLFVACHFGCIAADAGRRIAVSTIQETINWKSSSQGVHALLLTTNETIVAGYYSGLNGTFIEKYSASGSLLRRTVYEDITFQKIYTDHQDNVYVLGDCGTASCILTLDSTGDKRCFNTFQNGVMLNSLAIHPNGACFYGVGYASGNSVKRDTDDHAMQDDDDLGDGVLNRIMVKASSANCMVTAFTYPSGFSMYVPFSGALLTEEEELWTVTNVVAKDRLRYQCPDGIPVCAILDRLSTETGEIEDSLVLEDSYVENAGGFAVDRQRCFYLLAYKATDVTSAPLVSKYDQNMNMLWEATIPSGYACKAMVLQESRGLLYLSADTECKVGDSAVGCSAALVFDMRDGSVVGTWSPTGEEPLAQAAYARRSIPNDEAVGAGSRLKDAERSPVSLPSGGNSRG